MPAVVRAQSALRWFPFRRDTLGFGRHDMTLPASTPEPRLASVSELLVRRGAERPDQTAFSFLASAESGAFADDASWTYAELDRRARIVAAAIGERAEAGDRAALVFPPGLDFLAAFFGCLYAGVLPAPATYPKPRRPSSRLDSITEDCEPTLALTTAATLVSMKLDEQSPAVRRLSWLAVDECDASRAVDAPVRRDRSDPAFLQYTSGSTSNPRGVVVTHGNLLHNLELIRTGFGVTIEGAGVQCDSATFWLPAYHDMGLIGGILTPMYVGAASRLMAPATFLQRPLAWLETIARTKSTVSGAPNFAYDLCVEKSSPAERAALDLSHWKLAFCGAEPIDPGVLERFAEAFAPAGFSPRAFYPCYGLAEATLMVTGGAGPSKPRVLRADKGRLANHQVVVATEQTREVQSLVSCGQPLGDQRVAIVDAKSRTLCDEGVVGEIWIRGQSVAAGYWNRPEESAATFEGRLVDGSGPFLRTGDLGAIVGGELYVTGRLKDLIIIRGRNLYPQDVERTVQSSHAAADLTAAFSTMIDGREELVVVCQVGRERRRDDMEPVLRAIRAAIVEQHDVDPAAILVLRPASLPLTSSGKVQRSRCRELFDAGELDELASWRRPAAPDPATRVVHEAESEVRHPKFLEHLAATSADALTPLVEEWMLNWLTERTGVDRAVLAPDATFAELGLDSMTAVELNMEIESALGLRLPPMAAWNYPTPAALARYLAEGLLGVTPEGQDAPQKLRA